MNHFLICPIVYDPRKKSFSLKNAKLSYAGFRDIVKDAVAARGFDPDEYGTHSRRSDGATALAPKILQYELLSSGRWADPRLLSSYIETSDERRFEISKNLNINIV